MWECPKCRESVEDGFDVCWNCGTSSAGVEDPQFARADDLSTASPDQQRAECLVFPAREQAPSTPSPAVAEASNALRKCGCWVLGRMPRRFSLGQMFVVVTLVACFIALATMQRQLARLQVENARYRRELGHLEVTDPSLLYAVGLPQTEDWLWQWRLYVPKDGQYVLGVAARGIPMDGLPAKAKDFYPKGNQSGYYNGGLQLSTYSLNIGPDPYVILRTRLAKALNGSWQVRIAASNGWHCSVGLGEKEPVWLRQHSSEYVSEGQPVCGNRRQPLTLLRHRIMENRRPGEWTDPEGPCEGLMIWIDEAP